QTGIPSTALGTKGRHCRGTDSRQLPTSCQHAHHRRTQPAPSARWSWSRSSADSPLLNLARALRSKRIVAAVLGGGRSDIGSTTKELIAWLLRGVPWVHVRRRARETSGGGSHPKRDNRCGGRLDTRPPGAVLAEPDAEVFCGGRWAEDHHCHSGGSAAMPVLIFTVFPLGNLHVGDFIFRPV